MFTGISTASLFLKNETEDAISAIKSLGAECIEIFLGTYYEFRPEFAKKFAERAKDFRFVSVHSLSAAVEPQLFSASRRVRGDGFYWLDQIMRSANLFGAKKYSFHGYISRAHGLADPDLTAGYMRGICDFAARYGVDVCLENVCWCTYDSPGVFSALKARCPALAGVLDVKQAYRSGYPVNMYIEDMKGSLSHVHLSDVDERGAICLPGKGKRDFSELLKRLSGAGFDGPLLVEVYPDSFKDLSELKNSLDFLNELCDKIK